MNAPLRIIVADDEPSVLAVLKEMLQALGHRVIGTAPGGRELVEICKSMQPDLVLADIRMPGLDGLDAAAAIYDAHPTPIVLISGFANEELIERAQDNHVFGYLIKPIKQADLEPAIALARRRFEEFQSLQQESADLRQALADRKVIERAKNILMKHLHLDEPDAFRRLQKLASSENRKLAEIADIIVTSENAFNV